MRVPQKGVLDQVARLPSPEESTLRSAKGPEKLEEPQTAVNPGLAKTKAKAKGGSSAVGVTTARSNPKEPIGFLGKQTFPDAAEYARLTGITISAEEAARLDALVREVAGRIGLKHPVAFAAETQFQSYYHFAFVGTVKTWTPEKTILAGVGVKATAMEHITAFGDVHPSFAMVAHDFLELSEVEKIETVLVHEKLELDAILSGTKPNPHRTAVAEAPNTEYKISPRARAHLALYAKVDRAAFGSVP